MKPVQVKIASILLVFFIIQTMLLGSACISTRGMSGAGEKVLVSLDICGHGAPSGVLSAADLETVLPSAFQIFETGPSVFPPAPGKAVASVEPGETGKPPKPSLS